MLYKTFDKTSLMQSENSSSQIMIDNQHHTENDRMISQWYTYNDILI